MAVRPILPRTITQVTGLRERPVFFVTLNNEAQPALVVKGENKVGDDADVKASVRWASKMMKNVNNPLVNSKPLMPEEWEVFRKAAILAFHPTSPQSRNLRNAGYLWIKMPFVAGLSDADFVNDDATTSTSDIKEVLRKFLRDQVWRDLGKVVAVDLFVCNLDRFDWENFDEAQGRGVTWANRGNIMFVGANVIGLDPYFADRGGDGNANLNKVRPGAQAGLEILRDPLKRQPFALACTRAVSDELYSRMGRRMQGQGQNRREVRGEMAYVVIRTDDPNNPALRIEREEVKDLFNPFVDEFVGGLNAGADELKRYLLAKKAKYARPVMGGYRNPNPAPAKSIPQGIQDRMNFLHW
jgi:hypothetical protein